MDKIKAITGTFLAMILAFFSTLTAQEHPDAYRSELFQTSASPSVTIETSGGFIEVQGHDADEVRVDMIVRRGNRVLSPSDTDLSDFEITIHQENDRVEASAKRSGGISRWFGGGSNISVNFVIHAPHDSEVKGSTSGGSVTVKNISNSVDMRTSGGSVTAEAISGNADLRTSGGSITLNDIEGTLVARTSGGSIRADGLSGSSELATSGGSIRLENIKGSVSARTSGGSIRAHMLEFDNDLDFRTSGGSISVQIPTTEHFDVDLRGSRVNIDLNNFSGNSERNRVNGRMGNGGPKIAATTSGGSVSVEY
ncbi:DUF4097 family beta strand repeat-containing protein [Rhodohalobacter sp. SW132]|uniref:DUF4097 family beta strand repeat-containing protein n=1 Tax=Rhodohalobacter sp. SW132 TaxID=2293433 RepID=UPI001315A8EF|nr:DUF4097 family beta strand repeat-containing protein [Rhodohalobacter sp. SW132]